MIENAASTLGSDRASCCVCSPGTTAAYADEALALRFRSDGITRAVDGSLVWNADVPESGLAFTMTRFEEPHSHYDQDEQATYYLGNYTEPRTELPTGSLSGLHFKSEGLLIDEHRQSK